MNGEDFPFASAKVRFDANTQMTLFTAEGLLRGQVRFANKGIGPIYTIIVAHAYQRWVATQGCSVHHEVSFDGWLYEQKLLNRRRNPDRKAIQAVQRLGAPGADRSYKTDAVNHGPSGVARIAPVGIFAGAELRPESYAEVFKLGCEIAQITHRSPEGYLPAGFLALLIALILNGNDFDQAAHTSLDQLAACAGKGNVHEALEYAVSVPPPDLNRVALDLRNGRHGHEALALSLLICRVAPSFPEGMVLALRFGGYGKSVATVYRQHHGCDAWTRRHRSNGLAPAAGRTRHRRGCCQ